MGKRLQAASVWCVAGFVVALVLVSCSGESESGEGETSLSDARLEEPAQTEKRNVVLILLESTRARSVTPYNPDVETMPMLDELAEESLLVEKAYSVVPGTSKSLIAAECGVEPPLTMQIPEMLDSGGLPARCLPELLREEGYSTVFFENATEEFERRGDLIRAFGYEDFFPLEKLDTEGFERANYFGYEDDILLEPSREWLEKNGDEPFLASYETITPHHQYLAPTRYGRVKLAEDDVLNRYLNSVRYLDFWLQNLLDQYKDLGLYEDTIFFIYADHGEAFGEHGVTQHGNVLYEEAIRIPMIVHDPQRFRNGERVEGPANHLDIVPTALDMLGYEVADGEYPGDSLLSLPEDRPLDFSCGQDKRCLASLKRDEKYIYYFDERPGELFDLSDDPLEQTNLAEESPRQAEERRKELLEWRAENERIYEK